VNLRTGDAKRHDRPGLHPTTTKNSLVDARNDNLGASISGAEFQDSR
jgi:hypothetical protein